MVKIKVDRISEMFVTIQLKIRRLPICYSVVR
jgi:hypothetical protein